MTEDVTTVTLNEAKKYIINNINIQIKSLAKKVPSSIIFLSGAPGIGKSDLMEQVAKELKFGLNPQYLGTMLVEQLGMPLPVIDPDAKFQRWSDPELYSLEALRVKSTNTIILFLDDLHLATKTIQSYMFQLFTYRSIHNKKMPPNFVMVAAGNRSMDRAGAQPIMAPIVNRFRMLDIIATADDWLINFAIPKGVRHDIVSFIERYPDCLQSEPMESTPWASPRSWTYFSESLNELELSGELSIKDILQEGKGHIGQDYASKFLEYVQLFSKWDSDDFLTKNAEMPEFSDMNPIDCYAFMSSNVSGFLKNLRQADFDTNNESISHQIGIVKNMFTDLIDSHGEIVPLGLRSLVVSRDITEHAAPLFVKFIEGNPKLLEATKNIMGMR